MTDDNCGPMHSAEFNQEPNDALQKRIEELETQNTSLSTDLETANEEAAKYKDVSLRAKAELDNTIKRMQNDISRARTFGSQKLLEDLIPVIDSLELSLANDDNKETDGEIAYVEYEMIGAIVHIGKQAYMLHYLY